MSHYISKVHRTHENGDVDFIYYCGNYHWSSNPENRLVFDSQEEAATHLYEFGGAVTDVEPAPYVAPTTTVESTPVVEEPMVTFNNTPVVEEPVVQEETTIDFNSNTTSSSIDFGMNATSSSFGIGSTETFSNVTTVF